MNLLVEKPNNRQLMMKGTTDRMMSVLRPNTSESQPPKIQPPTFAKAQIDAEKLVSETVLVYFCPSYGSMKPPLTSSLYGDQPHPGVQQQASCCQQCIQPW